MSGTSNERLPFSTGNKKVGHACFHLWMVTPIAWHECSITCTCILHFRIFMSVSCDCPLFIEKKMAEIVIFVGFFSQGTVQINVVDPT